MHAVSSDALTRRGACPYWGPSGGMSTDTPRTATAVLPTRNNLDELTRCLASLQAQSGPLSGSSSASTARPTGPSSTSRRWPTRARGRPRADPSRQRPPGTRGDAEPRARPAPRASTSGSSTRTWSLAPDALAQHLVMMERRACTSQGQVVYANADEAPWAGYLNTRGRHRWPDGAVIPFTQFSAANAWFVRHYVKRARRLRRSLRGLRRRGLRLRVPTGAPVGRAARQQQEVRGHDGRAQDHRAGA